MLDGKEDFHIHKLNEGMKARLTRAFCSNCGLVVKWNDLNEAVRDLILEEIGTVVIYTSAQNLIKMLLG
jgi:hypothetical protein